MIPFRIVGTFMFDGFARTDGQETALLNHPDWTDQCLAEQIEAGTVIPAYSNTNWYEGPESNTLHRVGAFVDSQVHQMLFVDEEKPPGIGVTKLREIGKYLAKRGFSVPKPKPVRKSEPKKTVDK